MAEAPDIISFRCHQDLRPDFEMIHEWCEANGSSFNSLFNSYLPAIAYSIQNCLIIDEETGAKYIKSDFGDIFLRPPHYTRHVE